MNPSSELRVPLETGATTTALVYPAAQKGADGASFPRAIGSLILAHGAGAGQHSAFIVAFAKGLAALGLDIITFDFQYITDKRRIPDRGPVLEKCYLAVIATVRREVDSARRILCIGGKSMGGRIATQVAAADRELPVNGLVLLGYPLHPPTRPTEWRAAHLPAVGRPMLFVQGSRDNFGTPPELSTALAGISPAPTLHVVAGGDHSLKVPRRDPAAQAAVYDDVQRTVLNFMASIER